MNSRNVMAAHTEFTAEGLKALYIKNKPVAFECSLIDQVRLGETVPTKINEAGTIVGGCVVGTFEVRKIIGFIREPRKGALSFLEIPGAYLTDYVKKSKKGGAKRD